MKRVRTIAQGDDSDLTDELASLLVGRTVAKVANNELLLDDGTRLELVGNYGCAGCTSGGYDLTELNGCGNIVTKVELENLPHDGDGEGVYRIFVYADNQRINLATFTGSDGNGWYGTGYSITVTRPTA